MMFVCKHYETICKNLITKNIPLINAMEIKQNCVTKFILLKHDVETSPEKALKMAEIENKYNIHASYYVQAYLLNDPKNIKVLKKIQALGHEVSYHYDVLDECKGNYIEAIEKFKANKRLFEKHGFPIVTVCQHGNPVAERNNYHSNRDFFRNKKIARQFGGISDICVNFSSSIGATFDYISDAGYQWNKINDIEHDDLPGEGSKYSISDILYFINNEEKKSSYIISTHPHRWENSAIKAFYRYFVFKTLRTIALFLKKNPFLDKIMKRYFYLAKKI